MHVCYGRFKHNYITKLSFKKSLTINPALLVAHDKLSGVRRGAGLGAGGPAVAVLAAVIGDAQPALRHTLLSTEHPPRALRQGVANLKKYNHDVSSLTTIQTISQIYM